MVDLDEIRSRPVLSVAEAGEVIGVSRTIAYREVRRFLETRGAEGIPAIRFGARIVVPTAQLLRLLGLDPAGNVRESGASAQVRDAAWDTASRAGAI
jgi:hypothetical protein